jgi:hypothetical protein
VRRGALIIAAVLAGLVTLACSSGGGDSGPSESKDDDRSARTASAEGIDVKATWLRSDGEPKKGLRNIRLAVSSCWRLPRHPFGRPGFDRPGGRSGIENRRGPCGTRAWSRR